ncbi:hypothetical protein VKT23_013768 [Stygiomarasmius scandens]|uniref:Uncharacterized protein n=1 Tax=Marasmiellus scandens TaxID=2682957 RepID=A0ABR1J755_9AGAR
MEERYTAQGQAFFTLTDRYRKANQQDPEDDDIWFEVDGAGKMGVFSTLNAGSIGEADDPGAVTYVSCDKKSEEGNQKVQAQFRWQRTHNEQLLVQPCGVIYA